MQCVFVHELSDVSLSSLADNPEILRPSIRLDTNGKFHVTTDSFLLFHLLFFDMKEAMVSRVTATDVSYIPISYLIFYRQVGT